MVRARQDVVARGSCMVVCVDRNAVGVCKITNVIDRYVIIVGKIGTRVDDARAITPTLNFCNTVALWQKRSVEVLSDAVTVWV